MKYVYSNQDTIEENEYEKDDKKTELAETRENIYGQSIDDILTTLKTKYEDHGKKQKTETFFYQKNQLGSITAITDDKGKVVEEYRYDAFGKAYIRDGKSDERREFQELKTGNTRLFTGREYDVEVGLYYYRARYYSAELGRFISRDPIGTADNINLYTYVGNSPVAKTDPTGLQAKIMTAYADTLATLRQIISQGGEKKERWNLFNEVLTDKEADYYAWDTLWANPFNIMTLGNNKDYAFNNTTYNSSVKIIQDSQMYNNLTDKEKINLFSSEGWNPTNNVAADALRHSSFNALNARDFGMNEAKNIGDYHEFFSSNVDIGTDLTNTINRTIIIDLFNNSIGRSIGMENISSTNDNIMSKISAKQNLLIFGSPDQNMAWHGNTLFDFVVKSLQRDLAQ